MLKAVIMKRSKLHVHRCCAGAQHTQELDRNFEKVTQVSDVSAGERTCAGDARFAHLIFYRFDHAIESNSHLRDPNNCACV